MSDLRRPWCCVEPRCTMLHQIQNWRLDEPRPGDSFMCFGVMPRGIVFTYDGDRHENDLRSCVYTPLKGLVAWQENGDDWRMTRDAYAAALARLADGDVRKPDTVTEDVLCPCGAPLRPSDGECLVCGGSGDVPSGLDATL